MQIIKYSFDAIVTIAYRIVNKHIFSVSTNKSHRFAYQAILFIRAMFVENVWLYK